MQQIIIRPVLAGCRSALPLASLRIVAVRFALPPATTSVTITVARRSWPSAVLGFLGRLARPCVAIGGFLLRRAPRTVTPTFLAWLAATGLAVMAAARFARQRRLRDPAVYSRLIQSVRESVPEQRLLFTDFSRKLSVFPGQEGHSHPTSAAYRSAVNAFMHDVARESGYEPYSVSKSAKDPVGNRYFYFAKDLTMDFQDDPITENSCLIMTDVDYYPELNDYLEHFLPLLLYTFVPTRMAGHTSEYSWRFQGDEVRMSVSGGAEYGHPLWRFDGDVVTHVDRYGRLCVYNIEQRLVPGDENHRYICITPAARVEPTDIQWMLRLRRRLPAMLRPLVFPLLELFEPPIWQYVAKTGPLERLSFANGRQLYDSITDTVSLAADGSFHSVELSGRTYRAIVERLANKVAPPNVGDVERILQAAGSKTYTVDAPILFNLIGTELEYNAIHTANLPATYHPVGSLSLDDPPPAGRHLTSPLVTETATFPSRSQNSEEACIKGRIEKPRNDNRPPGQFARYATEFVSQVVQTPGSGCAVDVSEVNEQQDKAQQRSRFANNEHLFMVDARNRLELFVKAEPYQDPNDPRPITTNSVNNTVLLSAYTIPFKNQVLKKHQWYGPGLTPQQVVQRMGEICTDGMYSTDYSRFDGSVSKWLQKNVVYAAYLRWVAPAERGRLKTLLDQVFMRTARTKGGLRYDPGYGTRSGSAITTDGNTMINAFIPFAAAREIGMDVHQAMGVLGLYCGDDGAMKINPPLIDSIDRVCRLLGMNVKAEICPTGPYPFCGRYFPSPATSPMSFQDPMRTITKLTVGATTSLTREQAATNRATGYLASDSLTPIVGDWCRRVLDITGLTPRATTGEEDFKVNNSWPQPAEDYDLLEEHFCRLLNITSVELHSMRAAVNSATSLDDFPVLFETRLKPKLPCLVGDVLLGTHILENDSASQDAKRPATNQSRAADAATRSRDSAVASDKGTGTPARPSRRRPARSRKPADQRAGEGPSAGGGVPRVERSRRQSPPRADRQPPPEEGPLPPADGEPRVHDRAPPRRRADRRRRPRLPAREPSGEAGQQLQQRGRRRARH